jgi:2-C-methyl-D-erythritol 2,4-cyclodiphosphate synthase
LVEAARVGLGFDSHRFVTGRPLILGGVHVPFHSGLHGHSDADAVVHAVIDALLGAAGRGNIGERFPDTDPVYAGSDSCALLELVREELASDGWRVLNLDCVVIADEPRLGPHVGSMSDRLSALLGVAPGDVSIKPKTSEGLGLVRLSGRGAAGEVREAGLAAMATVLLARA